MKTPDEIKRGLRCYVDQNTCACDDVQCEDCPNDHGFGGIEEVMEEALAYIRELEARVAELDKRCDAAALNATTAIRELEETKLHCLKQIKVFADKLAEYEKPLVPLKVGYLLKENPVWLEYNSGSVEICELSTRYNVYCAYFIGDEDEEYLTRADYNKTWRCWLRRHTDEDRKVAKWDEGV